MQNRETMASVRATLLACVAALSPFACWITSSLSGLKEPAATDGDAANGGDALVDARSATYRDLDKRELWTAFDVSSLNPNARGFAGAAFDGRYLYLAPNDATATVAARYDTQAAALSAAQAWAFHGMTDQGGGRCSTAGSLFDGRYVYFIPSTPATATGGPCGLAWRFDTSAPFADDGSWSSFDVRAFTTDATYQGFVGGAFDGRSILFAGAPINGEVVTFDTTQGDFQSTWGRAYLAKSVDPRTDGFFGAAYDGRFVYFAPNKYDSPTTAGFGGIVVRHEAAKVLGSDWQTFDMSVLDAGTGASVIGFKGAIFDGRYVYFVAGRQTPGTSVFARYDTTADFATAAWSVFDLTAKHPDAVGYVGGTFDGRYVYFAPGANQTNVFNRELARYDTLAPFDEPSAWATLDLTTLDATVKDAFGAVFDGRNVYVVPHGSGTLLRFDAKSPPSRPPGYGASFL
jgi:hypothetical protein